MPSVVGIIVRGSAWQTVGGAGTSAAAVLRATGLLLSANSPNPKLSTPEQTVVEVLAAPINAVDRGIATGHRHYLSPRKLPVVCGLEGVGRLPGWSGGGGLHPASRS